MNLSFLALILRFKFTGHGMLTFKLNKLARCVTIIVETKYHTVCTIYSFALSSKQAHTLIFHAISFQILESDKKSGNFHGAFYNITSTDSIITILDIVIK